MVDYTTSRSGRSAAGGGIALLVVAAIAALVVGLAVLDGLSDWPETGQEVVG